ncbi:MAG TPA: histidinol-phosphatase HisJ family protein [Candidatus Limnocylindrales bacterium]
MTDRQARDLPLDAHLHTDLSPDSDVPIDSFARQATERGIPEIAITDHVDFDPGAPAYRYASFAQRERQVRDAAGRWADAGLAIRFGVEVTWDSRWAADIRDHLARHAYDFTIGSVHIYHGSPYDPATVASWVAGKSLPDIIRPYFDEVLAAIRSGLFDAIGHLDVVKRYLDPHVTAADLAAAPELYEPVLRALVDSGSALEINTSGLRQAAREIYPSPAVTARFRELGGERITVGSDAHRADTFAWALDDGYAAAIAAGFDALSFRRGRDAATVPIATTGSVRSG